MKTYGVESHLVSFARVGHHEHLPSEGQPEMRDLDGLHDAAELDHLVAPVELAHLAGRKGKRTKAWAMAAPGFPAFHRRTKRCALP